MPRYTPRTKTFTMPDLTGRFPPAGNPPDGYVITYVATDGYYYPKPTSKLLVISTPSGAGSPYNVLAEDVVLVPSHAGTYIVNLPVSPTAGTSIFIKDLDGVAATNNISVVSGANIDGAGSYLINTNYSSIRVMYTGTTWTILTKF